MNIQPNQLTVELTQFTGTQAYHRWSALFPRFVLTDGSLYLAEKAGAFWLMDVIASHQYKRLLRANPLQVWTLKVKNYEGRVVCTDGDGRVLTRQAIPFTDFPLHEIQLYAVDDGQYRVIMLPSEF